jgi:hypothetical protein
MLEAARKWVLWLGELKIERRFSMRNGKKVLTLSLAHASAFRRQSALANIRNWKQLNNFYFLEF